MVRDGFGGVRDREVNASQREAGLSEIFSPLGNMSARYYGCEKLRCRGLQSVKVLIESQKSASFSVVHHTLCREDNSLGNE